MKFINKAIIQYIKNMNIRTFGMRGGKIQPILLSSTVFLSACQALSAEDKPTVTSGGTLNITSTPYVKEGPDIASGQEQIAAWEYFFEKLK